MREAQRRGHEDALSGDKPTPDDFEQGSDWLANYMAGSSGATWQFAPLPWPAEFAFALAGALGTELSDRLRPRYPLARWAEIRSLRVSFGARRRRATQLGIKANAELPLLKANPQFVLLPVALLSASSLIAPRFGARRSLVDLASTLGIAVATHWSWRRAGLPTRPQGTYRA